jgi:hypothetical protein
LIHFGKRGETRRSNSGIYVAQDKFRAGNLGSIRNPRPVAALSAGFRRGASMELAGAAMEEGMMWIAFFSIASATAICLGVAAVMVQANQGDILRS